VNGANVHQLEGVVTLQNVLDSYGIGPGRWPCICDWFQDRVSL